MSKGRRPPAGGGGAIGALCHCPRGDLLPPSGMCGGALARDRALAAAGRALTARTSAPHSRQNLSPCSFCVPQLVQVITLGSFVRFSFWSAGFARRVAVPSCRARLAALQQEQRAGPDEDRKPERREPDEQGR